jgi:hypothetical protein
VTAEEMRFEIESVYAAVLQTKKPSVHTGQDIPEGVTPLAWHHEIPASAADMTPEDFRVQFGDNAGEQLALEGLSHGCTSFAKLTVRDREAVSVASQGGRGIPRRRERKFIVHALGWGQRKPAEYEHTPVWPHAMGADVPETSKVSKGEKQ